jgi:hypothetical protein
VPVLGPLALVSGTGPLSDIGPLVRDVRNDTGPAVRQGKCNFARREVFYVCTAKDPRECINYEPDVYFGAQYCQKKVGRHCYQLLELLEGKQNE